ncbi:MAG: hypothetical protein WA699_19565, partial [Pseudolabrys sp.]
SQVQKPLAIVVVSGMTLAPILILIVLPFSRVTHLVQGVCKRRHNRPSSLNNNGFQCVADARSDVRFWHKADMPFFTANVRFWG